MKIDKKTNSKKNKFRIAVVNSHPIQYFAPLYAYLNSSESLEVTALYCSDFSLRGGQDPGFKQAVTWDVDILSGYQSRFLGEKAKNRVPGGFWSLICPEVWGEIRSGNYDAVILHGQQYAVNLIALVAAKTCGVKVFMRGETHLGLKCSRVKKVIRKLLLNLLYKFCDRFLAIGTANEEFYRTMGVPKNKIVLVPYTVDNRRFIESSTLSTDERIKVLEDLGVSPGSTVVLYASKFSERKHPDDLLKAIALLRDQGLKCTVLMVGSGETQSELENLAKALNLDDVHFPGFINQSKLPSIFGACDVFVLPSENEPWALIVNEVMCAGLPVVISREVGCVADLIKHGDNGFIFNAGDVNGLAEALAPMLRNAGLAKSMGNRSRDRIANWSYEECLIGIKTALR